MFETIRKALGLTEAQSDGSSDEESHHLAVTALLIEAATLDGGFGEEERLTIARLISDRFGFDPIATAKLIDEAADHHADTVEIFSFTREIKDAFDAKERVEMIEMLWEVVYADEHLHDYEANLMRRIAGLLHVPDRDSGEAKKRVRARLGIDAS